MTETHRAVIGLLFDPPPRHVYLFREFMPAAAEKEIADPYGGPLDRYEACRDELVEALPSLVEFLKTLVAKPAQAD
jgi:protein-tyrosine phosphatase